jgi:hypothetical protein
VLVGVVDGLKGFPEAIKAVFPQATVQTSCLRGARFALSKPPEKCEACPSNHPESGECRPKRIYTFLKKPRPTLMPDPFAHRPGNNDGQDDKPNSPALLTNGAVASPIA